MKVVWSPLAERRAIEAVNYVAKGRPHAAEAWLEELISRVAALDRFAKRGRIVPEIGMPEYREIFHHPYRIIYKVDPKQILVLTVRHTRRDWDKTEVSLES